MSVMIIEMSEINSYRNQFINSTNLFATLNRLPIYHDIAKRFEHQNLKPAEMFQTVIDYVLWYCHVANVTAYNLQYRENVPIDFEFEFDDNAKSFFDEYLNPILPSIGENSDYYHRFGSLLYNVATNDGNVFMPKKYLCLAEAIYLSVKKATFFLNDVPLKIENQAREIWPEFEVKAVKNSKWSSGKKQSKKG